METISNEATAKRDRKGAESFILRLLNEIMPGGKSIQIYKDMFSKMSDKEFDKFMLDLKEGKNHLILIVPNFKTNTISMARNLSIAEKEFNYDFFQRLYIGPQAGNPGYLTPIKYMVVELPLKRQSQSLIKKISVADTNRRIDKLSGQLASGHDTKSARMTYPETQLLLAMGLDASLVELLKFRGGDIRGFNTMNAMIAKYGRANLQSLSKFSSGVESTKTLSLYLKAAMLKNNLNRGK